MSSPATHGHTSPRTSPNPRWPGMPSIPCDRPADPVLLACVPVSFDIFRCARLDRQARAQAYSLIRSKQAGMPGAYLLDGAHRGLARTHGASLDAHRSGHPRPRAPASLVLPEIGWAGGPRMLARGGCSLRLLKEQGEEGGYAAASTGERGRRDRWRDRRGGFLCSSSASRRRTSARAPGRSS